MNFEELRKLHRMEKNSSQLASISEDFFIELKAFLAEKKEQYLEHLKKGSLASEDFSNIERMARELLEIRERKILKKAFHAAMTAETSMPALCSEEKKLFNSIYKAVSEYKKVLDGMFAIETKKPKKPSKEKDLNTLSIQIIEDVPAFVGADMKEYGPFKKGQLVELPAETAEVLLARKLAVKQ
jgi:DNA replication factor GINS